MLVLAWHTPDKHEVILSQMRSRYLSRTFLHLNRFFGILRNGYSPGLRCYGRKLEGKVGKKFMISVGRIRDSLFLLRNQHEKESIPVLQGDRY